MLEISGLTKRFGAVTAVDDINLSIVSGAVLGVVGPGGSGKSTLFKLLAGLLAPSAGDAIVYGASLRNDGARARQLTGYMPSQAGVYPELSCAEYLRFFAECHGVPAAERKQVADDLLQLVDLYHRRNDVTDGLTPGMRQRLNLARAIVHDPSVLLLDEPVAGLDPRARADFGELIANLAGMGKIILISTGALADVRDVCTNAVRLERGRVSQVLDVTDPTGPASVRHIVVKYLGDVSMADALARAGHGVLNVRQLQAPVPAEAQLTPLNQLKEMHVTFAGAYTDASELLRSLMHSGVQIVTFSESGDIKLA